MFHRAYTGTQTVSVVRLEAIIGRDGTVQELKVLSGHPLLVKSALEAVQRWRYQPTLFNGEPLEIITEIDVNISLAISGSRPRAA